MGTDAAFTNPRAAKYSAQYYLPVQPTQYQPQPTRRTSRHASDLCALPLRSNALSPSALLTRPNSAGPDTVAFRANCNVTSHDSRTATPAGPGAPAKPSLHVHWPSGPSPGTSYDTSHCRHASAGPAPSHQPPSPPLSVPHRRRSSPAARVCPGSE